MKLEENEIEETGLSTLFNRETKITDSAMIALDQYKLCVEMADRVSARRQSANSFYLSITTFLLSFIFAGNGTGAIDDRTSIVLAVAGVTICFLWARSIKSYRDLNSGKFAVIVAIENELPLRPFSAEWAVLKRGKEHASYRPFNFIEKRVPLVFSALLILHIFLKAYQFLPLLADRGAKAVLQTVQWTV